MNHIHRQAALSLLKSGHSVTAATVQGGWRGRPDAPRRGVKKLAGSLWLVLRSPRDSGILRTTSWTYCIRILRVSIAVIGHCRLSTR